MSIVDKPNTGTFSLWEKNSSELILLPSSRRVDNQKLRAAVGPSVLKYQFSSATSPSDGFLWFFFAGVTNSAIER